MALLDSFQPIQMASSEIKLLKIHKTYKKVKDNVLK